jgi:hypothetical protein
MEKILLDELSNIISAYKEGKALQFYTSCGEFKDVSAEEFDIEKWYKKPKNSELSQNQSIALLRMQKSAGRKCKIINRLGG